MRAKRAVRMATRFLGTGLMWSAKLQTSYIGGLTGRTGELLLTAELRLEVGCSVRPFGLGP